MKKTIALLLLVSMLAGMTACGNSAESNPTDAAADTTAADTTAADTGLNPDIPDADLGGAQSPAMLQGAP